MNKFVKPAFPVVTNSGRRANTRWTDWARQGARFVAMAGAAAVMGLSTQAADIVTGIVKREVWSFGGATRPVIESGALYPATTVEFIPTFEAPSDVADNYGQRLSGVFIPPTTGNYYFIVSSDDDSDLFLSTDSDPAHKRMIAQQPGWNSTRNWPGDDGSATAVEPQKNSQTFTATDGTKPFATGIALTAGTPYYIEAVMHEGGGGDNLGVTAQLVGTPIPALGDDAAIPTAQIGIRVPSTISVSITPGNTTVYAGQAAFFHATVTPDTDDNVTYTWKTNGVAVAGANGPDFGTRILGAGDNGLKVEVSVTLEHGSATASSTQSTITVPATGNVIANGFLKWEYFKWDSRTSLEAGIAKTPTFIRSISSFETPTDFSDDYASRVSGYFIPDVSGNYVFGIAADDDADLFLSTDADPAKKTLVAQNPGWEGARIWEGDGGGGDPLNPQRFSDTWVPDVANPPAGGPPYAAGIALTSGTRYYIEAVHHEGGGGDNLEVTAFLTTDARPTNGQPSSLTGSKIAYSTAPVTSLTITTQPHSATVSESFGTNFVVAVSTDSTIEPTYQWFRDGVAIPGATSPTYGLTAASSDNNAVFSVVVSLPGTGLSVTSQNATLTVLTAKLEVGYVKWEYFDEKTRQQVEAGTAGPPTRLSVLTIAEGPNGYDDNYASRISGLFIPPADGDYVFFVNSDDDSDLFLSTDDSPANKKLIAQETGWSDARNWNGTGAIATDTGGEAKNSSTFATSQWVDTTPGDGTTTITLQANKRYYFEAVQHEGGGGDNLEVTFMTQADFDASGPPADNTPSTLTGPRIAILAPPAQVQITQQPAPASVQEGSTATFTVTATSDSLFPLTYQWQKNGADIAGATGASYTTPLLTVANNNDKYTVIVKALGANPLTSAQANLTVAPDTTPPQVVEAGSIKRGTGFEIGVGFNEPLDAATAGTAANYTLSKGTVTNVRFEPYATPMDLSKPVTIKGDVVLETSGLAAGDTVNLTISNVKDAHNNPLAAPVVKSVTISGKMAWVAVGGNDYQEGTLPAGFTEAGLNAANYYDDAVALKTDTDFDLISGGTANWDAYDEATFAYEEITGDFDRIVRVEYQDPTSQWARAGIMARTSLDEGVKRADVATTPMGAAMILRVNPTVQWSGAAGNNAYEWVYRDTVGGNYASSEGGGIPEYPNAWMRLKRTAGIFTGYRSTDGVNWTQIGTHDWTAVVDADGNPVDKVYVGPYYGPEFNNNETWRIGHSSVAKFRDYGPFGTVVPPPQITTVTQAGGNITITWTGGGTLEWTSALTPGGTWTSTGDSDGSYTEATSTAQMRFFRVKQ